MFPETHRLEGAVCVCVCVLYLLRQVMPQSCPLGLGACLALPAAESLFVVLFWDAISSFPAAAGRVHENDGKAPPQGSTPPFRRQHEYPINFGSSLPPKEKKPFLLITT